MQAHALSSTAARAPSLPSNATALQPLAGRRLAALCPDAATPAAEDPTVFEPLPSLGPMVAEQSGLAHDAGNLLGALRLYSDLLRAPGVLRPEHQHYAAELGLIASRSTTLIERLLRRGAGSVEVGAGAGLAAKAGASAAASAAAGSGAGLGASQPDSAAAAMEPARSAEGPGAVLGTLLPVLERIAAGAARVTLSVAAGLPEVDLPAEAVERIAVNLVRNAAQAIRSAQMDRVARAGERRAEGLIRIVLEAAGGELRLTVEDNGPGMPPGVAAAFLRPEPLPAGATRGLGHRIVHELAGSTGGKLAVRVRPGRGTTFCLRWPLPQRLEEGSGGGQAMEPLHRPASQGGLSTAAGEAARC